MTSLVEARSSRRLPAPLLAAWRDDNPVDAAECVACGTFTQVAGAYGATAGRTYPAAAWVWEYAPNLIDGTADRWFRVCMWHADEIEMTWSTYGVIFDHDDLLTTTACHHCGATAAERVEFSDGTSRDLCAAHTADVWNMRPVEVVTL